MNDSQRPIIHLWFYIIRHCWWRSKPMSNHLKCLYFTDSCVGGIWYGDEMLFIPAMKNCKLKWFYPLSRTWEFAITALVTILCLMYGLGLPQTGFFSTNNISYRQTNILELEKTLLFVCSSTYLNTLDFQGEVHHAFSHSSDARRLPIAVVTCHPIRSEDLAPEINKRV